MNRAEALAMANMVVGEWLDPPKNQRGYPVDGWKPTSATERAAIVVQLAEFLWEPEPPTRLVAPEPPEPHLHRASCHGAIGELQCGFPPGPTI
jgi:hypothetical protein